VNYVIIKKNCVTSNKSFPGNFILWKFSLILKSENMNNNVIGYWNGKKEKLRQEFPIITDEDLRFNDGKEKEMIEMLGYKLGKTKEELVNIIARLE
jgi:hypothetical protein